jgi:enoyl-CoA hydratase/carnithine racemase
MSVTRERRGEISVVTLDDPRTANALTAETVDRLLEELAGAAEDGTRCVVLTGSGTAFCAGGDAGLLSRWHEWEPLERKRYLERGPHAVGKALREGGFASVAAVNGAAYGAGMDIALSCDVRVASPGARFCEAYVRVGVIPGDGGAWLLPRVIGLGRALELLLTGREIDAEQALAWGVVTHLAEAEALLETALEVAGRLASVPPTAQRLTRELVWGAAAESWPEHLETIGSLMAIVGGSAEHRDALQRVMSSRRGRT